MRRFHARCAAPRRLALTLTLAVALLPLPARGAVRFDGSAATAGSGSASLDVTVGAGANRYLIVAIVMGASVQIGAAPRFGGKAMGPIASASGDGCSIWVYGLAAPASGTGTVTAGISPGTAPLILAAASYDGVHQTLPTNDTSAQAMGNTNTAFGTLYGANLGVGFGALCAFGDMPMAIPRAGQTSRWNRGSADLVSAASEGTGSTVNWQVPGFGASWAVATFPLRAAPGNSAPPPDAAASPDDAAAPDATIAPDVSRSVDAAIAADARALSPDGAAPDAGIVAAPLAPTADTDAGPRVINLVVGTGCRAAGTPRGEPGALALAGVALIVVVAARRRG